MAKETQTNGRKEITAGSAAVVIVVVSTTRMHITVIHAVVHDGWQRLCQKETDNNDAVVFDF